MSVKILIMMMHEWWYFCTLKKKWRTCMIVAEEDDMIRSYACDIFAWAEAYHKTCMWIVAEPENFIWGHNYIIKKKEILQFIKARVPYNCVILQFIITY